MKKNVALEFLKDWEIVQKLTTKANELCMWLVLGPLAIFALFFVALFIDANLFNGRFLNRAKTTDAQLKESLKAVLSQGDLPIEAWNPIPQDWISDKMTIPLQDSRLDAIRLSVVTAIGDGNEFKCLSSEAKLRIQEAIDQLK